MKVLLLSIALVTLFLLGTSLKFRVVKTWNMQVRIGVLSWNVLIFQNILAKYITDKILKYFESYKKIPCIWWDCGIKYETVKEELIKGISIPVWKKT